MDKTEIKTESDLRDWIGKAQNTLNSVSDIEARTKAVERLLPELQEGLDTIKRTNMERQEAFTPTGSDAEVDRAYYVPSANREDLCGGVGDITKSAQGEQNRQARMVNGHHTPFVGSGGGVVRMIGALDECGYWEPGLLDDKPKSEWQYEAQRKAQYVAWLKQIAKAHPTHENQRRLAGGWRVLERHMKKGPAGVRKVFSDNAGEGGEWIVTIPMTMMERYAELPRVVAGLFQTISITSNAATLPFLSNKPQPFVHNVPTSGDNDPGDLPKSMVTTTDRTINAVTMTVSVPVDLDALEDNLFPFLPILEGLVSEALNDGEEDCHINGDTAATHGDTGFASWNPRSRWDTLGASNDHRTGWIGLRHRALDLDATLTDTASDFNATQTVSAYIGARSKLTSPHGLGDIVYLTSPEHLLSTVLVDSNVLTVDKYGPNATILTGEVAQIGGRPLVISEFMTSDLATSGLYTGSGSTTSMLIVNRARFRKVTRRNLMVNVEIVYRKHTAYVVATVRTGLHTFDGSSTANVRYLYNLTA